METVNTKKITNFTNWESIRIVGVEGATADEQEIKANFLSSYHFHLEKFMNANASVASVQSHLDNFPHKMYYSQCEKVFDSLNAQLHFPTMKSDPFWSAENLDAIIAKLNYPDYGKPLKPFRNIDYATLLADPKYRMYTFLDQFNAQKHDPHTDVKEYNFMYRVITRLLKQMTRKIIMRYKVDGVEVVKEIE